MQWVNKIYVERAFSIIANSNGDVYNIGRYQNTVDLDPSSSTYSLPCLGTLNTYISKISGSGNFIWGLGFGGLTNSSISGCSLVLDKYGDIFITGNYSGTIDFDPGIGTHYLNSIGGFETFICKLNSSGNFLWVKTLQSTYSSINYGSSIKLDDLGNIYVSGLFNDVTDFDPGIGGYWMSPPTSNDDYYLLKLNNSGNFIWAKQLTAEFSFDIANPNNIIVARNFNNTLDFDPNTTQYLLNSDGGTDISFTKLDSLGNFIWAKRFGGTGNDNFLNFSTDTLGNIFSIGRFISTVDFDPGPGSYNLTPISGLIGTYVNRLDVDGNFVWAEQYKGEITPLGLISDKNSNIYIYGGFSDSTDFDPGPSVYNLFFPYNPMSPKRAGFINKLDSLGQFQWVIQYSGYGLSLNADCTVNSVSLLNNSIYSMGYFAGAADFDPGIGTTVLSTVGTEYFTNKLNNNTTFVALENEPSEINIYPIPFSENLNIKVNRNDVLIVKIYNSYGQIVFIRNFKLISEINLYLTEMVNGIYTLEVSNNDVSYRRKIIKQ